MLNSIRTKHINCENEARFIQERITLVERNIAELCHYFSAYSRKAARLRDKGDEVARASLAYANAEDINNSLSDGLENFASTMSVLSDYGDMRVQNIDTKVVNEFSQYENICKHVKEEVKQIYAVRDKELTRKKQLDRIRERNPRNRQQILAAETELVRATAEVSKTIHGLEEQITTFERQKLHDIKYIFLDFISGEMGYHAKALELLTKAFQDIQAIDEEADLEDFKKSLRQPETMPHANPKRGLFRNSQSLGSISTLFSTPKKRQQGIPRTMQKSSKNLSKSEEVLDSPKTRYEDSENSGSDSQDEDQSEEKSIRSNDKVKNTVSQFTAKRYLK